MLSIRNLPIAAALLALAATTPAQSGFKLIAHRSVSADSLAATEVSRLFLKKTDKLPDGTEIVPVDQKVGTAAREAFSDAVHHKGATAVDAYWQKRIFSGRGLPPVTQATDAQVVAFVKATPGAVGYVSPGASTAGVKVIVIR